jgi:hypothetical protein
MGHGVCHIDMLAKIRIKKMTFPKPKFCGQNWLDMNPTKDGRLCGGCKKNIVDFSKKSFSEIEKIQSANNNSICGMYSKKQINNWGQSNTQNEYLKKIVIAASSLIVVTSQIKASDNIKKPRVNNYASQSTSLIKNDIDVINDSTEKYIEINGVVFETDSLGKKIPISFANVFLKSRNALTTTDEFGKFKISIPLNQLEDTLIASYVGYARKEIILNNQIYKESFVNIELKKGVEISVFYVSQPSLIRRAIWSVKRLFKSPD